MIETQNITLNSLIVEVEGNVLSDMNGEKVMLSISNGNYYNLGKVGGVIWGLLNSPIEISKIVDTLLNEYQVGKELCEEQVLSFISHLHKEGLIRILN